MAHATGTSLRTDPDEHLSIEEVEAREKDRRARHRSHDRIAAVLYPVATMVGVIVLWEVVVRAFDVPSFLAPPPSQVVATIIEHGNLVLRNTWVTTVEIMLGYLHEHRGRRAAGVRHFHVAGVFAHRAAAADLIAGHSEGGDRPAAPGVVRIRPASEGAGRVPDRVLSRSSSAPRSALPRSNRRRSTWLVRWVLARTATFFKIRLPNALPSIFAGLKISITLAVVGAVVGEFVGGEAGLGYMLMVANGSMDTPLLFAGLIALTIQGVVLYALVEWAERLAIPRRSTAATAALQSVTG